MTLYNYGAIKAYKEGIVTVLSLMSNMEAAPHAVRLWQQEAEDACMVQHTNFVQGYPVSRPEDIPSLVDGEFEIPPPLSEKLPLLEPS